MYGMSDKTRLEFRKTVRRSKWLSGLIDPDSEAFDGDPTLDEIIQKIN
jgi:hypothetical protein